MDLRKALEEMAKIARMRVFAAAENAATELRLEAEHLAQYLAEQVWARDRATLGQLRDGADAVVAAEFVAKGFDLPEGQAGPSLSGLELAANELARDVPLYPLQGYGDDAPVLEEGARYRALVIIERVGQETPRATDNAHTEKPAKGRTDVPEPNYLDKIALDIGKRCDSGSPSPDQMRLLRIYAVLALSKGTDVTNEDVHNAWSAWTASEGRETHSSLIPFGELPLDVQALDEPYRDAIRAVAAERGVYAGIFEV